jgi:hypothetical protein
MNKEAIMRVVITVIVAYVAAGGWALWAWERAKRRLKAEVTLRMIRIYDHTSD